MMDYAGRVAQADTYPKLLRLNASEHGGEIALREKDFGLWRVFTWNDYQARVHDFALGMVELGLGSGDVIGIIGDNRPDWVSAEIATHAIGAMSLGSSLSPALWRSQTGIRRRRRAGRQALDAGRSCAQPQVHRLFRSARDAEI
jgi:acyl-CoA synthetase (AMP-forming)/AMP-acid ligase II